MADWFTIDRIDGDTFAISEYAHWEETHCYLLLGAARALLIDTGLGVASIRAQVGRLTALPVTVAATHVHWDHIGGHGEFDHLAVHELERDWLDMYYPTTDPVQFLASVRKIRRLDVHQVLPGHHRLDIPASLAGEIERGLLQLERTGRLRQGGGLFQFGSFQLHL